MRHLLLTVSILLAFHFSFAQNAVELSEIENAQDLAFTELQVLENQIEMGGDGDNQFVFALFIPSALAATADFILVAGAAGYISMNLADELNLNLNSINIDLLSPREILNILNDVFFIARRAKDTAINNEEKLRDHGYSDDDIDEIQASVSSSTRQCNNRENNNSPESFCPNFRDNFGRENFRIEKRSGGYIVTKRGRFQCCLEWDDLHCGFEIFDRRGRHQGEVGCLEDEFDPCEANLNRGRHARAQTDHRPRSQTCR